MIRLSYNHARVILVTLASLLDATDDELREVRNIAATAMPEIAYYAEEPIYGDDIKAILKGLIQQVMQPEDGSEGMLLDEIIRVLQSTHGRGAISKQTLAALQLAALTQTEMAAIAAKLRDKRMSCASCGLELEHGEVLVSNALEGQEHSVRCLRCAIPTVTRCSFTSARNGARCEHAVAMNKKVTAVLQNVKHYCEEHAEGKETVVPKQTLEEAFQGVAAAGLGDRLIYRNQEEPRGQPPTQPALLQRGVRGWREHLRVNRAVTPGPQEALDRPVFGDFEDEGDE